MRRLAAACLGWPDEEASSCRLDRSTRGRSVPPGFVPWTGRSSRTDGALDDGRAGLDPRDEAPITPTAQLEEGDVTEASEQIAPARISKGTGVLLFVGVENPHIGEPPRSTHGPLPPLTSEAPSSPLGQMDQLSATFQSAHRAAHLRSASTPQMARPCRSTHSFAVAIVARLDHHRLRPGR